MSETKDVTIGDRRYRLGKMTALVASRVHNWILSGAAKIAQGQVQDQDPQEDDGSMTSEQRADGIVISVWVMAATLFSEELIEKIQTHCLKTCFQYPPNNESAPPVPIMVADGRWAVRDMEHDAMAVSTLVREALKFNVSPFFTGNISSSVLGQ